MFNLMSHNNHDNASAFKTDRKYLIGAGSSLFATLERLQVK